jgi:TPR repeat protein
LAEAGGRSSQVDAQLTLGHLYFHGARGLPANVELAFEYGGGHYGMCGHYGM